MVGHGGNKKLTAKPEIPAPHHPHRARSKCGISIGVLLSGRWPIDQQGIECSGRHSDLLQQMESRDHSDQPVMIVSARTQYRRAATANKRFRLLNIRQRPEFIGPQIQQILIYPPLSIDDRTRPSVIKSLWKPVYVEGWKFYFRPWREFAGITGLNRLWKKIMVGAGRIDQPTSRQSTASPSCCPLCLQDSRCPFEKFHGRCKPHRLQGQSRSDPRFPKPAFEPCAARLCINSFCEPLLPFSQYWEENGHAIWSIGVDHHRGRIKLHMPIRKVSHHFRLRR